MKHYSNLKYVLDLGGEMIDDVANVLFKTGKVNRNLLHIMDNR